MNEKFAEQTEDLTPEYEGDGEAVEDGEKTETPESQSEGERIAALEAKLAELSDQYLRKAADFENSRKRMNREKQDAIDFANQSLLLDLIPVIDDFERAIQSAAVSKDFGSLYEGIAMTEKRLITMLENKWGLKRFDSAGEPFDPNRHEALMMEKSADVAEPVVQEDFIKGYTLKDRVIRSAKVKVIMPEAPSAREADLSISAESRPEETQNPGAEKAGD
ncbi:MAG: nucleotide exchange factor GrpE [Treponema sp.]|jgi:molecular chaperone GrpE|nr:nucleotide exchange factor GrpE [Treponema sp.]